MWAQLPHPLAPKETGLASQAGAPSFTLHSLPKPSEFLPCLYPWTPLTSSHLLFRPWAE